MVLAMPGADAVCVSRSVSLEMSIWREKYFKNIFGL